MIETMQDTKLWLIREIAEMQDPRLLNVLKTTVQKRPPVNGKPPAKAKSKEPKRYLFQPTPEEEQAAFRELVREGEMPYEIDLEQLMKEQGFTQPDEKRILQLIKEIDVQEPVEELLALLTK